MMKRLVILGTLLITALSVMGLGLVFGLNLNVEAAAARGKPPPRERPLNRTLKCAGYTMQVDLKEKPYGSAILSVQPPPLGAPISTDHVIVGSNDPEDPDLIVVRSDGQPWILVGLGGNDTLIGGDGDDAICGGDGDDALLGGLGNDNMRGGMGCDHLNGGPGNDTIDAGVGNDAGPPVGCDWAGYGNDQYGGLFGQEGDDILRGRRGQDYLSGGHTEFDSALGVVVNPGNDHCDGGPGSDEVLIYQGESDCENIEFVP